MAPLRTRSETLKAVQRVAGELPDPSRRVPLGVAVIAEQQRDGLVWRKITFAPESGDRCWAWLILPESRLASGARPGTAMLCLHQTTRIGKDEPVGLGGKPNLHYALELAQRGHVVLAPDYPRFGDYAIDVYALGYASATMKGLWNHIRALDLLCETPAVDPARLGCVGHSLGAHNALFLAAFDSRVRAVVSSCGFTRWTWNNDEGRGRPGDLSDWSHAGYMPWIAERYHCRAEKMPFDWEDVLAAIAPRPIFINAPRRDFFQYEGVDECVEWVRPLYGDDGADQRLALRHPDCDHDFPPAVREDAYGWFQRWLE